MSDAFQCSVDADGIGHLIFDLPQEKVNKLSLPVFEELEKKLDSLAKNSQIKALLITSGKPDNFIAGADIHGFEPAFNNPQLADKLIHTGHRLFNKLDRLPFPTIALIHGACLGGGLELALACSYRIATDNPKTVLGVPEVTLGLIMGWGGTQRLPRLVGLTEALPMILSGKPIKTNKALKIHLIDALVPAEFAQEKAKEFVQSLLTPSGKSKILHQRKNRSWKQFLLERNPIGRAILFHTAKKELLKKTKGHYPAPEIALALIKETATSPLQLGLQKEIETVRNTLPITSKNAKNLISLFFIQESLKKDPGITLDANTRALTNVGVLGAGIMGSAIAWLLSYNDYSVRFKDINWDAVGHGYAAAYSLYSKKVKEKQIKLCDAQLKFHRMTGTIDYTGFEKADLVIEAATENLELKHQIIEELEEIIRPNAIIATNTSSLTVEEISNHMKHPERFLAMHFFNPPYKMPLVEVVPSKKTTPEAVATAVELCRKLGRTPIVVGDCTGFLVNRIFMRGVNEIAWLFQEGVQLERLEKIMLDFGMPLSPFVLSDEIGNDTVYKTAKSCEKAYGERMKVPNITELMYQHQLFGKKNGKGFYIYNGKNMKPNPEVEELIRNLKNEKASQISDKEILDRMMLSMVDEASRCLEEKIISNPAYLDMALIMGIGFPPFRGGLLRYADSLGISYVVNQLQHFCEISGNRFAPSSLLIEMHNKQKSFH